MSDDDEDYDELPPITVTSSSRDSSSFSMPCASEVANERARAEHCERELASLRAEHSERVEPGAARSDSSGSEGEASLAAAVGELRVRGAAPAGLAPRLADLAAAAAGHSAAPAFLADYAHAAHAAGDPRADALAGDAFRAIAAMARDGDWGADEVLGAGAWLCLALAAPEGARLGAGLLRLAHLLLEQTADDAAAAALVGMLLSALPAPRARLELADALRGGGARSAALAGALAGAALDDLLPPGEEPTRAWRRLASRERLLALRLAGRARAHAAPPAAERAEVLLAALAAAPPPARDRCPDALKVLVAASKLQVLFRVPK